MRKISALLVLVLLFIGSLQAQTYVDFVYPDEDLQNGYYESTATIAVGSTSTIVYIEKSTTIPNDGYCTLGAKVTGDTVVTVSFANYWGRTVSANSTYTALSGTVTATSTAQTKDWNIGVTDEYFIVNRGVALKFSIAAATDTAQVINYRVEIR